MRKGKFQDGKVLGREKSRKGSRILELKSRAGYKDKVISQGYKEKLKEKQPHRAHRILIKRTYLRFSSATASSFTASDTSCV